MGDKEVKIEKIDYTPEELSEIDRIVQVVATAVQPSLEPESPSADDADSDAVIGEPSDLDLPESDLDSLTPEFDSGEPSKELPLDDVSVEGISDIPDEISEFPDDTGLKEESIDEVENLEFEDISDIITEVEDTGQVEAPEVDMLDEDVIGEEVAEDLPVLDELSDIEEIPFDDVTELEAADELDAGITESADSSPLDQLEALTSDEPESIDVQDLADDEFVSEDIPSMVEETQPVDEIEAVDDITAEVEDIIAEPVDVVTIEKDVDQEIPDLSELPIDEVEEIPETEDFEVPDIELDELDAIEEDVSSDDDFTPPVDVQAEDIDAESIIDDSDFDQETDTIDISGDKIADIQIPDIEEIEEPLAIEPLDDDHDEAVEGVKEVELTSNELKKLKKAIILYNPALRRSIKNTVINDQLPPKELRQFVDMIISGKPEDNIHRFLERKLKTKIILEDEAVRAGRKVITSRPEYAVEGRDRQKRLLKLTKIFSVAALGAFLITILSYQYIYKPLMAKKKINEGVALILSSGDYTKKPRDYKKAEDLFRLVDENYIKDYPYGYNAYGRAYFDKREYNRALNKLDRAYRIDSTHIDTLNSLGYFYSKLPASNYRNISGDVEKKYYLGKKLSKKDKSQLNIAIDFFRRALIINSNNLTSLVGIGNAYFYQGQFLKAKKYYENILKIDKDSVIGYSGLLNLYIERDAFSQVSSIFNELRYKKMMHKIPSALLGKFALYFLNKRKTEDQNVRIDYGVRSTRIKDIDDNTYPAVNEVLMALNKRDQNYPPLQVYLAMLNQAKNNIHAMKRHLEKALVLSPKYFDALHLMGEHKYNIKEPVESYRYLNRAMNTYGNQPEFTKEEFYSRIFNLGRTYAITGNIFYYFFDRVRYNSGDPRDELLEDDLEKLANYNVARDKYEKALVEKFESSELHYNLGRIYYMNRLYRKSLNQWLHLYEDFVNRPELMFALGNAFYHLGNYEASKGEYLKLISVYEYDANKIKQPETGRDDHVKIFRTLASAYNNVGAIYQVKQDEARSSISYWKAIDYAKRLNIENEFARVNMARSYKTGRKIEPIIDESIPYSIDIYREEMRK